MMNPHELPHSFMSLEDDSDFFTWRVVFEGPADSLWQTQGVATAATAFRHGDRGYQRNHPLIGFAPETSEKNLGIPHLKNLGIRGTPSLTANSYKIAACEV